MKDITCLLLFIILTACGSSSDTLPDAATPDANIPPINIALPVQAAITCDNSYGFGYGTEDELRNYFGGVENIEHCDIFCDNGGVEDYTVPKESANAGDYLYLITWADRRLTNGVIGSFVRGNDVINTGTQDWQVCATGIPDNYGNGGPSNAEVQQGITNCNLGDATTTSHGWQTTTDNGNGNLAIGEENQDPVIDFPVVFGIDSDVRWMWYKAPSDTTPFRTFQNEEPVGFLLFRLAVTSFPNID